MEEESATIKQVLSNAHENAFHFVFCGICVSIVPHRCRSLFWATLKVRMRARQVLVLLWQSLRSVLPSSQTQTLNGKTPRPPTPTISDAPTDFFKKLDDEGNGTVQART